jgi:hypothetical protein
MASKFYLKATGSPCEACWAHPSMATGGDRDAELEAAIEKSASRPPPVCRASTRLGEKEADMLLARPCTSLPTKNMRWWRNVPVFGGSADVAAQRTQC